MAKNFLTAYAAGKRSVEDRSGWQSVLFVVVGIVLWDVVKWWLARHYPLPRFESFVIVGVVVALFVFVFSLVKSH